VSTSSIERVTTARLVLERLQPEHAEALMPLMLDPRVAATLWPLPEPPTSADVREGLVAKVEHWERYGFGMWLACDRMSGEMVGRGGLQFTYTPGLHEIEAGWAIMPDRWGHGLATELAWASVEAAFGPLGLRHIIALALPQNRASRRVMEKTGFLYERDLEYAGLPHVLYRRRPDPA
jgi:ribosomal-protein-alanine N-acetyltransferase